MKKTEFVQIKTLSIKELTDKAKVLKKEIAELVFDKNMKKLKDLKSISKRRKERARVLTLIGQKELLARLESGSNQSSDVSLQTEKANEKTEKPKKRKGQV